MSKENKFNYIAYYVQRCFKYLFFKEFIVPRQIGIILRRNTVEKSIIQIKFAIGK